MPSIGLCTCLPTSEDSHGNPVASFFCTSGVASSLSVTSSIVAGALAFKDGLGVWQPAVCLGRINAAHGSGVHYDGHRWLPLTSPVDGARMACSARCVAVMAWCAYLRL